MPEDSLLSMEQMKAVLDNVPVAICVSEIESRKIIYTNQMAREVFLKDDMEGGSCFLVAGFKEPCPFCHVREMKQTEFWVREFKHPVNNCVYQLSGKLIEWEGKPAHIEYISDITRKKAEEEQSREIKEKLQATFNSIPCGLSVYRFDHETITPLFHNPAFYHIMGYSEEHIRNTKKETTYLGVHPDDVALLKEKIETAISTNSIMKHTYRLWHDKKGEYRFICLESSVKAQKDGTKILYGIYSDVSEQKWLEKELISASEKLQDIVNAIPGGVAIYKISDLFETVYFSDGVSELSGYPVEEYAELVKQDALKMTYQEDKEMVVSKAWAVIKSQGVADFEFRMQHRDGHLVWVRVQMKFIGEEDGYSLIHCVFHNISDLKEAQMFQSIADETADGIYVIDQKNYELLYANESGKLSRKEADYSGKKCYEALYGKKEPCGFCTFDHQKADDQEHEMLVEGTNRFYSTRFRKVDWNGIPAYVKYVRDVTEEVHIRMEKERLEMYFRTVVEKLPGGVAVICCEPDGSMKPEYISDGLADMLDMTVEEVKKKYETNFFAGVYHEDVEGNRQKLQQYIEKGNGHCELTGRMERGEGSYVWVRIMLSLLHGKDGMRRLYAVYTDITSTEKEKEQLRSQYEELIRQHYSTPGPDTLIIGHCNVTQNKILEIMDYTGSDCLNVFGDIRQEFFLGISGFIVEEEEQQAFLRTYLNEPMLEAFERNETEQILQCFVKLPKEDSGRYVRFKVNLVETPDTGDVTGILTVIDITEQIIAERVLYRLSGTSHDVVIELDLEKDYYKVLSQNRDSSFSPPPEGKHSARIAYMVEHAIVPRDREQYEKSLDPVIMRRRLKEEDSYTFAFSVSDELGDIRTKNIMITGIDQRLGRVCLMCTDITESVREQQGLLNMLAYTFELMGFIHISDGSFTMYTRRAVLENLPPYRTDQFDQSLKNLTGPYIEDESEAELRKQFKMENILKRLKEEPAGYDFVFPYRADAGLRYKQINVLWGDQNHRTVCLVRADVTDILAAERKAKETLEQALSLAEEANLAKSDFLSAMSHDIRTPMNAIMGMTVVAQAHLDDRARIEDCLQKITVSSRHLLSLINDVLDMSRIERSKITLNHIKTYLPEFLDQLAAIMESQAKDAGVRFDMRTEGIRHAYFYGDSLRMNQILINILSNAVKFSKKGGYIDFLIEEIKAHKQEGWVRYRFTVSDTGIGMPQEFLENIFTPFARNYSAERIEGTGLGLSITKGLVDLMEGEISVESKIDQGSVFRVELEYQVIQEGKTDCVKERREADKADRKDKYADCCFLIVEDNAINSEIICEMLSLYGIKTVSKADGIQAVQEFKDTLPGTYDAILMDIQMPGMNGYEATRMIRKLEREDAAAIPIIAMTANAFSEDIQKSVEAGMSAHMSKPIDMDVLWETLNEVLGYR